MSWKTIRLKYKHRLYRSTFRKLRLNPNFYFNIASVKQRHSQRQLLEAPQLICLIRASRGLAN